MSPQAPTVSVRNATFRHHEVTVFEALDLELEGGKWTCLLGPCGIGKTSLLRLIAGLTNGDAAAEIRCSDGRPLAGRLAYMAQQDLLLPWCNAIDNVCVGPRLRGRVTNADTGRATQLLADLGLAGRERDLPRTLSGGMRQRVALARTLFEDRPCVVMDEPFSALDAITRYHLQELAAERLGGRTVLLVTHDPFEALRLGHRIVVLAGQPARISPPIEPAHTPPRRHGDPQFMSLYAELWERLAA